MAKIYKDVFSLKLQIAPVLLSMKIVFLNLLISMLLTPLSVWGGDIGLSVRALGMGNAYTAVVDDGDSIFYNPTGLAQPNRFHWTFLDPALGVNQLNSIGEYTKLVSNVDENFQQIISKLYGNSLFFYSGAKSVISYNGFFAGFYGVTQALVFVENPILPRIDMDYRLDYGIVGGWAFSPIPKMLSMGFQVRRVMRQGGSASVGVSRLVDLDPKALQEKINRRGVGYAFDWGFRLKYPHPLNPTLSFVWRDFGNTTFISQEEGVEAPQRVLSEQILGLGFHWKSFLVDIRPSMDWRFVNQVGMQIGQKVNMGVEFSFPFFDVRGGFHQGYLSYGGSFDLWIFRTDVASYGVEVGEYAGQKEDRRYLVQLSFNLDFDGQGGGGIETIKTRRKNRRLKQRR